MKPVATYRVQLNNEFDFNKLKVILPYLSQLGISHIYASPIVQARHGSSHGYDGTDLNKINEDLGGKKAFEALHQEAASQGLEWIQDIVPNHIAYSPESTIVFDMMKYGSSSKFYNFLDVDWNHPSPKLNGKILAPFLNDDYEKCLQNGEIKLAYNNGFQIQYGGMEFPVRISSYKKILNKLPRDWSATFDNEKMILAGIQNYDSDNKLRTAINEAIRRYNSDVNLLKKLLSEQIYALADWKDALKEINYRRFFDQSDLICLCMEEMQVFETAHQLIQQLLSEKKVTGLRVDHVDGLYDPERYLKRLRKLAPDAYIVVEKILLKGENLPASWPIQGTTGYDFLNLLNGLFVESENEEKISSVYGKFTRNRKGFDELVYQNKKSIVRRYFGGDIENLARLFLQVAEKRPYGENCSLRRAREAIVELLSSFRVYRTYFSENSKEKKDCEYFKEALKLAKQKNEKIETELNAVEKLLEESATSSDALQFIMRLQQFTGPIMAKGLEDTAFYVYNRLLSINEVGGDPSRFGCSIEDFRAFQSSRQAVWPSTMNATATHDTKRGEDFRARLNVLSEVPAELDFQLKKWSAINLKKKKTLNGKLVPSKNEEYYIYQTLIGSFPFDISELDDYKKRVKQHITKALREAKMNSNWLSPNQRYEEATGAFLIEILDSSRENPFLCDFLPFQKKIAFYGFLNSLSQTLVKIFSPGVPDFYQGTELWDLNLVDPDNRRPIDFDKRQKFLKKIQNMKPAKVQELLNNFEDGQVKIFEIYKALGARNRNKDVFQDGDYIPLKVKGALRHHIIAFCRKKQTRWAVIVAPRFLVNVAVNQLPLGDVWMDTVVCLPRDAPKNWKETFTGEPVFAKKLANDEGLWVAELLRSFPVALLLSEES